MCVCVSRSVLVPGDAHKEGDSWCVCVRRKEEEGGEEQKVRDHTHPADVVHLSQIVCLRIWECVTKANNSKLCVSVSRVLNFDGL